MQEEYKKASRGIILTKDKKSLVSIKRTKYKDGNIDKIYYTLPGGHVEGNETYEETLIREIKEEISVDIEIIKEVKFIVSDDLKKKEKFYLCKILSGEIKNGNGPEFTNPNLEKYGKYEIVELNLEDLHKYNVLPLDIKDYISNNLI